MVLQKLKDAEVRPKDLAAALGVKKSLASMMLSGQRGIPMKHLDAIAMLLGLTVPQLFTDSDLLRQGPDQQPIVADSQPQREVMNGLSIGAAPSRVQQVDPAIVDALENVSALVLQAIAEAKGQSAHHEAARIGKDRAGVRKRAGGHR